MELPIYDDHFHVSPSGLNVEAMKQFKAAGGTGMTLVTLPYSEVPITCGEDFRRPFEITRDTPRWKGVGTEGELRHRSVPQLIVPLAAHYGMERAEEILTGGMDIAHEMIASGKAQLMGEVGRPHFETDQKYFDACNRVLQHGMDLAHEKNNLPHRARSAKTLYCLDTWSDATTYLETHS